MFLDSLAEAKNPWESMSATAGPASETPRLMPTPGVNYRW